MWLFLALKIRGSWTLPKWEVVSINKQSWVIVLFLNQHFNSEKKLMGDPYKIQHVMKKWMALWIPFIQECVVTSLLDIGSGDEDFHPQCTFIILSLTHYLPLVKVWSFWIIVNLYPDCFVPLVLWNWPEDPGKGVKNVKSLPQQHQQWTNYNQLHCAFGSGELKI